ncbi:MAG TPA: MaoC family dehydratase N-terminal domain-containing protein [Candidatus Binataceae bacterium]
MSQKSRDSQVTAMDVSDVQRWVGRPLAGARLKEPIGRNDIRRWVQGMQNPNRLYYDDQFAAQSALRELIAPQSFLVCCTVGLGAVPGMQGNVPGVHMLLGGDEYWFYGPRVKPGDRIRTDTMLFDYRVTETKFGGPTLFSRGDTSFFNQRGEAIGKLRSSSIRYNPENARRLDTLGGQKNEPQWTAADLARLEEEKFAYCRNMEGHVLRNFDSVRVGEELPLRPIGPHSIQSFTSEWRSFIFTVWGAQSEAAIACARPDPAQTFHDVEKARIDPGYADGLYAGPSRAHVLESDAQQVGVPRGYGYGAVMGAWVLDYLANWAGELGLVIHSNVRYTAFPLTGDVTYFRARVAGKTPHLDRGYGIVAVEVEMKNQDGIVIGRGPAEIRLPGV